MWEDRWKIVQHDFKEWNLAHSNLPLQVWNKVILPIQKATSHAITKGINTVSSFVDKTLGVLHEYLWDICYVEQDRVKHCLYHINKKGIPLRWQGQWPWQIMLTVSKKNTICIQLNPYGDNYGKFTYSRPLLSIDDLISEMPTLRSFLLNETILSTSKFVENSNYDNDDDILKKYWY